MNKYEKPVAEKISFTYENQVVAESSGDSEGCYTVNAYIHQRPETGREDYRIQVNGQHHADHTREHQILTLHFNMPVTYSSSNGNYNTGNGTTTLVIDYYYHQNPTDNIGLGDVVVTAGPGLELTGFSLTD